MRGGIGDQTIWIWVIMAWEMRYWGSKMWDIGKVKDNKCGIWEIGGHQMWVMRGEDCCVTHPNTTYQGLITANF